VDECKPLPMAPRGAVYCNAAAAAAAEAAAEACMQGLTLVHISAQLEPCLTHKNTLHTLNTP